MEAVADDGSGAVRVVWHNRYPSFAKALEGRRAALYGTPVATPRGEMRIENPETELLEDGDESDPVHAGRIVGVYHRAGDVPTRLWRSLVSRVLDGLSSDFAAVSAPPVANPQGAAKRRIFRLTSTRPDRPSGSSPGRSCSSWRPASRRSGRICESAGAWFSRPRRRSGSSRATSFPFPLTNAQKRTVREIADDLASGRAMARLLQGDVGSGKTVVAGLALLIAAKNGAQGALMAPTEILAEQHAMSLSLVADRGRDPDRPADRPRARGRAQEAPRAPGGRGASTSWWGPTR